MLIDIIYVIIISFENTSKVPITETVSQLAAISKRHIKMKLHMLIDRKKCINQPGRLTAHLMNELNLVGKHHNGTQVRAVIETALDELEADGIITLMKSGKVYDSVERIIYVAKTKEPSTPSETSEAKMSSAAAQRQTSEQDSSKESSEAEVIAMLREAVNTGLKFKEKYESELSLRESDTAALKSKVAQLEQEKSNLESSLAVANGRAQEGEGKAIAERARASQAESRSSRLDAENFQLKDRIKELEKLNKGLAYDLESARKEIKKLDADISYIAKELEAERNRGSGLDELVLSYHSLTSE